ncbi:SET domain-containing protein [Aureococcus anophagefferens]|nr:SET domain-containing protein [Aureococcus anophagefferens]
MLLAPPAAGDGNLAYQYHGVTMRARPIAEVPSVAQLADRCSAAFGGTPWNVGVDVVCYRDGRDSCGWHADDTQGETLVLAVVLESVGGPRRVQLRPKQPPHRAPGGAPKRKKRVVAILREGDRKAAGAEAFDDADTGLAHASLEPPDRWDFDKLGGRFGHVDGIREGVRANGDGAASLDGAALYSRERLVETGGHNQAQRGVSGSLVRGAESVVVSRQSSRLREADGVSWLRYTSTRRQGAARSTVAREPRPARVFRSSNLGGAWAPTKPPEAKEAAGGGDAYKGAKADVPPSPMALRSPEPAPAAPLDALQRLPPPQYVSFPPPPAAASAAADAAAAPALGGGAAPPFSVEDGPHLGCFAGVPPLAAPRAAAAPRRRPRRPPPAPPPDALRYERAYTFRLERREAGNACSNAAFLACLSAAAGGRAPEPDTFAGCAALPPLDHWAGGDSDDDSGGDAYDGDDETFLKVQRRDDAVFRLARCAEKLMELVALVVAEQGGFLAPAAAPPWPKRRAATMADAATWLAHRKLYWRHAPRAAARLLELAASAAPMPETKRALEWADALGASSSRILRRLVADATKREDERPVSDALLAADDDDGAAPKTCALCGAGDDEALGAFLAFADRGAGAGAPKTHVHEACAACSSGVFLDDGGDYCNVLKEVKRGRGMRCAADKACTRRPKLSGATVGCGKKSCKRSYHVPCAATGWCFGPSKTFYCARHRGASTTTRTTSTKPPRPRSRGSSTAPAA